MKTPRVTDFYPNAKPLKSSLDNMPAIQKPKPTAEPAQTQKTPAQTTAIKPATSPKPQPQERKWVRRTYDIYEDQVDSLLRLTYEKKIAGENTSISDLVREAIDDMLKKHASKK